MRKLADLDYIEADAWNDFGTTSNCPISLPCSAVVSRPLRPIVRTPHPAIKAPAVLEHHRGRSITERTCDQ